jgi:hypothetical protein
MANNQKLSQMWIKYGCNKTVTTLTLGSRPKQRHEKVSIKNATQESHSHSQECERMWGNELTHS